MRILRAQSVSEYSIGVAVIILAIITMHTYVRRGLQGRYADLVDHVAMQASLSSKTQYEPYYLETDHTIKQDRNVEVDIKEYGWQLTDFDSSKGLKDEINRTGVTMQDINYEDDE
jgi:hypothetical protein